MSLADAEEDCDREVEGMGMKLEGTELSAVVADVIVGCADVFRVSQIRWRHCVTRCMCSCVCVTVSDVDDQAAYVVERSTARYNTITVRWCCQSLSSQRYRDRKSGTRTVVVIVSYSSIRSAA